LKALVTGATGFLGSHLVKRLIELGHNVVVLVRDIREKIPFYEEVKYKLTAEIRGDTADGRLIERTLHEYNIDTVFHLAAQTQVKVASASPYGTWETNVRGTYTVLDACYTYGKCEKIIIASSDKAYGAWKTPYQETDALDGVYPYDASKSCVDLIARSYAMTYLMPIVTVRCSNLYGPGDLNWARIVPATMRWALKGDGLTLRGGGTMKRDYMHVFDAARAYILLTSHQEAKFGAFNFGCEKPIEIREIVSKIARQLNVSRDPVIVEVAQHEIKDQWMNCQKAHEILGWHPEVDIDTGLKHTVDWYRSYLK